MITAAIDNFIGSMSSTPEAVHLDDHFVRDMQSCQDGPLEFVMDMIPILRHVSTGFNIEKILLVKRTPRRGDRLRRLSPLRIPRNTGRGFRGPPEVEWSTTGRFPRRIHDPLHQNGVATIIRVIKIEN